MPFGFGRGGGYGRGGGRAGGGGMGLGFRGSSPPWPYVGRGRGGFSRCGYYVDAPAWPAQAPLYGQQPAAPEYVPYPSQMRKEEELGYLKDQA